LSFDPTLRVALALLIAKCRGAARDKCMTVIATGLPNRGISFTRSIR
jgi:hypothetical protein